MRRILLLLALTAVLFPFMAGFAHGAGFPNWGSPLLSCVGSASSTPPSTGGTPPKVCTSVCDILQTLQNLAYFGMTLVTFVIGPVLLLWGGIMILISQGSTERLGTGKKILTGTVWAIVIALGAFVIVNTFLWAFGNPTAVSWPTIQCTPR